MQQNPFQNWAQTPPQSDLFQIEQAFIHTKPVTPPVSGSAEVAKKPFSSEPLLSLGQQDQHLMESLAQKISDKLIDAIEKRELIVDRAKLEELKVDNQLMARHIYSLLQNREIQGKQLNHLQKEKNKLKKLFWKFYIQQ